MTDPTMVTRPDKFYIVHNGAVKDLKSYYYYEDFSKVTSNPAFTLSDGSSIRYNAYITSGSARNVDEWNNVIQTGYEWDNSGPIEKICIIEPGTRPRFCGPINMGYIRRETSDFAQITNLNSNIRNPKGDYYWAPSMRFLTSEQPFNKDTVITITRTDSKLTISCDRSASSLDYPQWYTQTKKYTADQFPDYAIPKRLLVELQAGGGSGSGSYWSSSTEGCGGGAGGYWCGIIDISYGDYWQISMSPHPQGTDNNDGRSSSTSSINCYSNGTTIPCVVCQGGGGGIWKGSNPHGGTGGDVVEYSTSSYGTIYWTLKKAKGGNGGLYRTNGGSTNPTRLTIIPSAYCTSTSTQTSSRGSKSGGSGDAYGGIGGGGGASILYDGGTGTSSFVYRHGQFGSGGAGGDNGGANTVGGDGGCAACIIHIPTTNN